MLYGGPSVPAEVTHAGVQGAHVRDHEHPSVGERDRGISEASEAQRAGRRPRVGDRVVELGCCEDGHVGARGCHVRQDTACPCLQRGGSVGGVTGRAIEPIRRRKSRQIQQKSHGNDYPRGDTAEERAQRPTITRCAELFRNARLARAQLLTKVRIRRESNTPYLCPTSRPPVCASSGDADLDGGDLDAAPKADAPKARRRQARTLGRSSSATQCTSDQDRENSCPLVPNGVNCCDTSTGICYANAGDDVSRAGTQDAGFD